MTKKSAALVLGVAMSLPSLAWADMRALWPTQDMASESSTWNCETHAAQTICQRKATPQKKAKARGKAKAHAGVSAAKSKAVGTAAS